MKPYLHILIMFFALGVSTSSCKDDTLNCPALSIGDYDMTNIGDAYVIQTANILNNCLHLVVSYSGGCTEHDFELRWNNALMESFPPQALLTLYHNANQDPCDAVPSEHLFYDLNDLDPNNTYQNIIIHLQNYPNSLLFTH